MAKTNNNSATGKPPASGTTTTARQPPPMVNTLLVALVTAGLLNLVYIACREAFQVRLYAIREYGRVIHEFDPYFNYRATEYLWANGWTKFRTWFDYMVWYPLGRPVGTTIYPGMQVTSVLIKKFILPDWSINDICCFVPAWFGVLATLSVGFLTYECTQSSSSPSVTVTNFECILNRLPIIQHIYRGLFQPLTQIVLRFLVQVTRSSWGLHSRPAVQAFGLIDVTGLACAMCAALIMCVVPAHLSRSIAGGYDNESIAMTAMVLTFACWTRALRDGCSEITTIMWGAMTGLAYFYMAAAWGGYVFVLNLIGIHATVLIFVMGRYTTKLHRAYTAFYLVGTILAIQVPVVGWTPLKSLEQLGPFLAFGGMQLIELSNVLILRQETTTGRTMSFQARWVLRVKIFAAAAAVGAVVVALLAPTGFFGPISSRVRGLFVKHTKTGNPLVDSVAEHQPASPQAYFQYLYEVVYLAPVGFLMTALFFCSDSSSFLLVYAVTAYFFSHRMVRLILLTAPIASSLGGIAVGRGIAWAIAAFTDFSSASTAVTPETTDNGEKETSNKKSPGKTSKKGSKKAKKDESKDAAAPPPSGDNLVARGLRIVVIAYLLNRFKSHGRDFYNMAHEMARQISHPTIMQKGRLQSGEEVIVDDYREAYFWLRDNTPEDARIMAWWDYGYQITGIANRTTIADGNTWNHEHIALLGRTLTAPEKDAHRIIRHMADYVLVWAGGGGDDLAKSPHLRRIANSVYRGLCKEPTCREFGFFQDGKPTPTMEASLLYTLCLHGLRPGVEVDRNRFKIVHQSKYGKVRIYQVLKVAQDSKEWVKKNVVCDAPGSWFCPGQYPPPLEKILKEKKDFKQLEDFNVKGEGDEDYQKQYFENIHNMKANVGPQDHAAQMKPKKMKKPDALEIDMLNEKRADTEVTSLLYDFISQDRIDEFKSALEQLPQAAHVRSADGRGPMWWAHEFKRAEFIKILKENGVSETRTDDSGRSPLDLYK